MTSSNGNIFRVTGHLCGEFTGPRWIPHTKASDAELWCFFICVWINDWLNNREAGDMRRHHAHYDSSVMDPFDNISSARRTGPHGCKSRHGVNIPSICEVGLQIHIIASLSWAKMDSLTHDIKNEEIHIHVCNSCWQCNFQGEYNTASWWQIKM